MKRVISVMMAIIITMSCISLEVFADEGQTIFKLFCMSDISNLSVGSSVTVEIRVENNRPGHNGGNLYLDIPNGIELDGTPNIAVKKGEVTQKADLFMSNYGVDGTSRLFIAYAVNGQSAFDTDGVIATVVFKIVDGSVCSRKNLGLNLGIMEVSGISNKTVFIVDDGSEEENDNEKIVQVSAGGSHAAALTDDGFLYMWGSNNSGQLGNGTETDSYRPIKIMEGIKSVSLGDTVSSAIAKDGSLYMWGYSFSGQLGNGEEEGYSNIPIKIMDNVSYVTHGDGHSAAITEDGKLYMWGFNYCGQLGNQTEIGSSVPMEIMDSVKSVSLGYQHSAAITADGSLYTWGDNSAGELGDGSFDNSNTPKKIMDNVIQVSLGWNFSAALTSDGSLYMWGQNNCGQLANGDIVQNITVPQKIMDNVAYVDLGDLTSSVITKSGELYTWGQNFDGCMLGTGSSEEFSAVPQKILDDVMTVDIGSWHSMAVTNDGTLYAWGSNVYGGLGNGLSNLGSSSATPKPVQLDGTDDHDIVMYLSDYNPETKKAVFRNTIMEYTASDTSSLEFENNIDKMLNRFVLVKMDITPGTFTDIIPVETKTGMAESREVVSDISGQEYVNALVIDGERIPVIRRNGIVFDQFSPGKILYHMLNGVIVGYEFLEVRIGRLDSCDQRSQTITIDGIVHPTYSEVTDWSFVENIDRFKGTRVGYYVMNEDNWYGEAEFIFGIVDISEMSFIRLYSNDDDLTVYRNQSLEILCRIYHNGVASETWDKPAFVIGNPNIADVVEYSTNSGEYKLTIKAKSLGKTSLTVSDSDTGANISVEINVTEEKVVPNTYIIDSIPTFYPNVFGDRKTLYNFYNFYSLYVNNYKYVEVSGGYDITFDVYNTSYMYGSVDVYNKNGKWIQSAKISKNTEATGIYDVAEDAFFLIADGIFGKLMSYTSAIQSKKSSISIHVPYGGYFTISNNYVQSPGTYLYNSIDMIALAVDAGINIISGKVETDDILDGALDMCLLNEEEFFKKYGTKIAPVVLQNVLDKKGSSVAKKLITNSAEMSVGDAAGAIVDEADVLLKSAGLDWKEAYKITVGVWEGVFEGLTGPIGVTLKGLFSFSNYLCYGAQTVCIANSCDNQFITVYTPQTNNSVTMNGVTVNADEGIVDPESVLQVFRVSPGNIDAFIGDELYVGNCELYNICFIKNQQEVQPNGKVTVKIPIPDGMLANECRVYRQEPDGGWTYITAHVEGDFLVFETDHFSMYLVTSDKTISGDVNDDGEVTLDDAILTLKFAMNVDLGDAEFIESAADVSGDDGSISLDDAITILKIAMNVSV